MFVNHGCGLILFLFEKQLILAQLRRLVHKTLSIKPLDFRRVESRFIHALLRAF